MAYPYESGYCTSEDVLQFIPNQETWAKTGSERINGAILDTAVEIDAILARFYVTPVSGDQPALNVLRVINKALARAYLAREFQSNTDKATVNGWHDYAMALLNQIVPPRAADGTQPSPTIRFVTAQVNSPTELPAFPAGSIAQFNPDNDSALHPEMEPFFARTDRMPWRDGMM